MAEKKITPKAAGTEQAGSKTKAAGVTKKTLRPTKRLSVKLDKKMN